MVATLSGTSKSMSCEEWLNQLGVQTPSVKPRCRIFISTTTFLIYSSGIRFKYSDYCKNLCCRAKTDAYRLQFNFDGKQHRYCDYTDISSENNNHARVLAECNNCAVAQTQNIFVEIRRQNCSETTQQTIFNSYLKRFQNEIISE